MVSIESGDRQGPTTARRTEGDLARRRALADAASGVLPGEAEVAAGAARIQRFRCVIYLCGAPNADIGAPRKECTEYAEAFGWEITSVIEDRVGLLPPDGREGLVRAIDSVKGGEAGAVLTAWRSMISPVPQEYDQIAGEIEKAGGFLHVKDSERAMPPGLGRTASPEPKAADNCAGGAR
ncbi:hypothetical protein PV396_18880 [Streptomyces sp. ME02-8801-2C]|uniref:hypothetical protein n=1 Tax=Streptomyces sp. ME02-8801-2C TaxID=3028680 RepID=UPI0029AAE315|nr:hypothetical protein [Streptomyces sp. ME02-8801-2C]MDX3453987.1 hypothetical protein [Streptomyces sp. ME02-8801-2C]